MTPLQYYEPTAFNIRPTYAPVLVVSIVTSTIPRHLYCVTTCIFSLFYFITCWLRLMRLTTSNKQKRSVYDHESMIAPPIAYDHGSRTLVFLWLWRWSGVGSGEEACPAPDYHNKLFVPTQHPIFTPGLDNRLYYHIKIMSYLCYKHLFQSVVCRVYYWPFEKPVPSEKNVPKPHTPLNPGRDPKYLLRLTLLMVFHRMACVISV